MAKTVLITGAGKRIGAACARLLHASGFNVIVHYKSSQSLALQLCDELNALRAGSAVPLQADLLQSSELNNLAIAAERVWGGIDVLINNASLFYPQPLMAVSEADWDALLGANLKSPFFLVQALAETLTRRNGCIVNLVDIHAERGLPGYPVYSIAKAGLAMMTKCLAKELAPHVRVNAVSPGAILWPEQGCDEVEKQALLERVALQRLGAEADIAKAVRFLIEDGDYITGQILNVDGGRTLFY